MSKPISLGYGVTISNLISDEALLEACDRLRNEDLAELGVRLEDKDGCSVIKIVGKEAIRQAKEEERMVGIWRSCDCHVTCFAIFSFLI